MNTTGMVKQRLESLDALRGFDMFWIMGADNLVMAIAAASGGSFWQEAAVQMEHPAWNGFHFYDLIFPLFLFIAGVATPYSVGKALENGTSKQALLFRIIKRSLVLVLLGFIVNNHLSLKPIAEYRFGSVLGRIGLAYMFANIIYLYCKERTQLIWFWSLLIGYWLLLKFTSAPGFPTGDLTMEGNFASYLDRQLMPGKLYLGIHDPEGFTSTIPAISTGLLGIMTGSFLKNPAYTGQKKALVMAGAGIAALLLARLWNLDFPINKNLWTSSFVLYAGGFSLLLLAAFYYVIDVLGYKKWAFFFKVIGMNSILIYISGIFIDWNYANNAFFKWLFQLFTEPTTGVVYAICYLLVKFAFLYFLYKKKIFLRV